MLLLFLLLKFLDRRQNFIKIKLLDRFFIARYVSNVTRINALQKDFVCKVV